MKKRILSIFMALLVCGSITSCGKSKDTAEKNQNSAQQTESNQKSNNIMRFENYGFECTLPEEWDKYKDKNNFNFSLVIGESGGEKESCIRMIESFNFLYDVDKSNQLFGSVTSDSSKEEMDNVSKEYHKLLKPVCEIVLVDKTVKDTSKLEELFSNYQCREKLASQRKFDYYLIYNNKYDDANLSDDAKKAYKEICEHIKDIKDTAETFNFTKEDEKMVKCKSIEFKAKTIDGKEISSDIFKENKLTMINIWETFCGPCIEEMPELQKLYEEEKNEKVNVISIVADTPGENTEMLAKEILKKKGVEFTSIIPDENLKNGILKAVPAFPTTIFVDSNGQVVGNYIVSARSKDKYKKEINKILETLK